MSYRIVAEYRAAKAGCHIVTGTWPNDRLNPSEFMAWFRRQLHRKITGEQKGRKYVDSYQNGLRVDRRRISDYIHLRHRSTGSRGFLVTRELQRRFPHINNQED